MKLLKIIGIERKVWVVFFIAFVMTVQFPHTTASAQERDSKDEPEEDYNWAVKKDDDYHQILDALRLVLLWKFNLARTEDNIKSDVNKDFEFESKTFSHLVQETSETINNQLKNIPIELKPIIDRYPVSVVAIPCFTPTDDEVSIDADADPEYFFDELSSIKRILMPYVSENYFNGLDSVLKKRIPVDYIRNGTLEPRMNISALPEIKRISYLSYTPFYPVRSNNLLDGTSKYNIINPKSIRPFNIVAERGLGLTAFITMIYISEPPLVLEEEQPAWVPDKPWVPEKKKSRSRTSHNITSGRCRILVLKFNCHYIDGKLKHSSEWKELDSNHQTPK